MRTLVVLRGAPGCGKSTFIEQFGLKPYTLCADSIRELFESPVMDDEHGVFQLSQKNDKEVWKLLFDLLEQRMIRGELCVVDATHSRPKDFSKYKELVEKYRYRTYCVTFDDVPIETCKAQNKMRPEYKQVPESVIDTIYARMQSFPVPAYFKCVSHLDDEAICNIVDVYQPFDANGYEKVVVFGDIHGCWEPLKEYFEQNPFSEKNLYVFTGDYVDRGIQNREVVKWLIHNYDRKNLILLEGNHERWIMEYSNGDYDEEIKDGKQSRCKSAEFFNNTVPQLEGFSKKDLRQVCRRFRALAYFVYDGKRYFVNHAGVGFMPDSIVKVKSQTFIRGNGRYEDAIDKWFEEHELERNPDLIQIHAHRNIENLPMKASANSYNLCDTIEFGGNLRILEISRNKDLTSI